MFRIIILLIIILSISFFAHAQTSPKIGLGVSYVNSNINDNEDFESKSRIDFSTSLNFELNITGSQFLCLDMKLQYDQKGYKHTVIETFGGTNLIKKHNFEVKFKYLSFPIRLKLRYLNSSIIEPFLVIGPRLSFLIGKENHSFDNDFLKNINSFQYGINSGIGISMLSKSTYQFSIEYNYDFDLNSLKEYETTGSADGFVSAFRNNTSKKKVKIFNKSNYIWLNLIIKLNK